MLMSPLYTGTTEGISIFAGRDVGRGDTRQETSFFFPRLT